MGDPVFLMLVALAIAYFYYKPSWRVTQALALNWKLKYATRDSAHQGDLWRTNWVRKTGWIALWAAFGLVGFWMSGHALISGAAVSMMFFGALGCAAAAIHLLFYALLTVVGPAARKRESGGLLHKDQAERRMVWMVTLLTAGLVIGAFSYFGVNGSIALSTIFNRTPQDTLLVGAIGAIYVVMALILTAVMRNRDILRTGVPRSVLAKARQIEKHLREFGGNGKDVDEDGFLSKDFWEELHSPVYEILPTNICHKDNNFP